RGAQPGSSLRINASYDFTDHGSFLPSLTMIYLRSQTPYAYLVAHASTFGNGPGRTRRSAGCERTTRRTRDGRVAVAAASSRHAHAPARDTARAADRSGPGRLRRARPAGPRRRGTAPCGTRRPVIRRVVQS